MQLDLTQSDDKVQLIIAFQLQQARLSQTQTGLICGEPPLFVFDKKKATDAEPDVLDIKLKIANVQNPNYIKLIGCTQINMQSLRCSEQPRPVMLNLYM